MFEKLEKIQQLVDISNEFKNDYPDISDMLKMISELLLIKIENTAFVNRESPDEKSESIAQEIMGA